MSDKITEIRARHERIQRDCTLATPPGSMAGQVAAVDAHEDRATLLAEVDRLRAETEQLRDILRRVSVQPDRDRTVKISFFSEGDSVSWSVHPQTRWAREVLAEFEQDRRRVLKANP